MTDNVTPILWADDDSRGSLVPMVLRLRRNRFNVTEAIDYYEALEKLRSPAHFTAVLLDVILPYAKGAGALEFDLGMKLAEEAPAISGSVRNVAFLTVVRPKEVGGKYNSIVAKYDGKVRFEYFDKAKLLEPLYPELIMQFLRQV
jgi:CheY-like chemotaxis protein